MNYPDAGVLADSKRIEREKPLVFRVMAALSMNLERCFDAMAQHGTALGVDLVDVAPRAVMALLFEAYRQEMSGQAADECLGLKSLPLTPEAFGALAERIARECLEENAGLLAAEMRRWQGNVPS